MAHAGLFITATGTGVGKTFVTRGIARAMLRRGHSVAALKPLETGCEPSPQDALALARACNQPRLAHAPGLYRAQPPLAPYAATLCGEAAPPDPETLAETCRALAAPFDFLLVEGAGGLLVPLDAHRDFADLAATLRLPLVLVAPDALGVLSHVLTAHQAASARDLQLHACVLVASTTTQDDPSPASNARILSERLPCPVLRFPRASDDDDALADATERAGLLDLLS